LINNLSHTFKSILSTPKRQTNMSSKHPYISAVKSVSNIIEHLRKGIPRGVISADTLKKLGIAPNNESYLINILNFVGIIDHEGKPTEEAEAVLTQHSDEDFRKSFEPLVKKAYPELFDLHSERAWGLERGKLTGFFRNSDKTSAVIGDRQAATFMTLASLCGHGKDLSAVGRKSPKRAPSKGKSAKTKMPIAKQQDTKPVPFNPNSAAAQGKNFGLAIKIEINLPAGESKATYDNIFKSLRENLLDD